MQLYTLSQDGALFVWKLKSEEALEADLTKPWDRTDRQYFNMPNAKVLFVCAMTNFRDKQQQTADLCWC